LKNISNIFVDKTSKLGKNVKIYSNCMIVGESVIGDNCIIYPGTVINNSYIGNNCEIKGSYIEDSKVEDSVIVGPYAHIREKSHIGKECKIGNFVEVKNSLIGSYTKASHLAYIGDVDIGEKCNIGCGAIFVNYNGKQKSRSIVGNNCFIGSNCNIIAPVNISDNTYICAGTTLTIDTQKGDFIIGRSKETVKENLAYKYLKERY